MTNEERDILTYMRGMPQGYFSALEIARRAAGRHAFMERPDWARPFLSRLVEKGVIEMDAAGHYRLCQQASTVEANGRRWVSPHFARLLRESKKDFKEVAVVEIGDEEPLLEYA